MTNLCRGVLVTRDFTGNRLLRVPEESYRVTPGFNLLNDRLRLELDIQRYGDRFGDAANSFSLPVYTIYNANLRPDRQRLVLRQRHQPRLRDRVDRGQPAGRAVPERGRWGALLHRPARARPRVPRLRPLPVLMKRRLGGLVAALCVATSAAAQVSAPEPDVVLRGVLTSADHESYREIPFAVPAGVERITVEVAYTGREEKTAVDLGLRDPHRFRGWSGGNKSRFTLSAEEATPSYLPGALPAGRWRLILGVPNIRRDSRSQYVANIWFGRAGTPFEGFAQAPLRSEPGWYRGDLHSHTAHSDGSCAKARGGRAPCPLHRTVDAAAERGLDFIAVTDHNATSHYAAMRELQPFYDRLLLLPGREITTFQGHANLFGPTRFIDFQVGSAHAPAMADVLRQARVAGGLVSINHPASPSGEACMGCGWTAPGTDWRQVDAVEVVNGGSVRAMGGDVEGPLSGVPFWETRLNAGFRLTAIGGSDNHDAGLPAQAPSAIGRPLTVVYARELSQPVLLEALRSGRVFLDLEGSRHRLLDVSATAGPARAVMGGEIGAPPGTPVRLNVRVVGAPGARIELIENGRVRATRSDGPLLGQDETRIFVIPAGPSRGWIRANIRGPDGRLLLLGNPIYLDPEPGP